MSEENDKLSLPSALPPINDARGLEVWLAQIWRTIAELRRKQRVLEQKVKKLEEA